MVLTLISSEEWEGRFDREGNEFNFCHTKLEMFQESLVRWTHLEDSCACDSRLENKLLSTVMEVIEEYVVVEIISVCIENRKCLKLALWITLKVKVKENVTEK